MIDIDISKHTPGPWIVKGAPALRVETAKHAIAWFGTSCVLPIEEQEANAALSAMAPDLLAENKQMRNMLKELKDAGELLLNAIQKLKDNCVIPGDELRGEIKYLHDVICPS